MAQKLLSLCEKCPYSEFFWSLFRIHFECGKTGIRKTGNMDIFYAVCSTEVYKAVKRSGTLTQNSITSLSAVWDVWKATRTYTWAYRILTKIHDEGKSVQIRSYLWFVFFCIRTGYGVSLHIKSEYREIRTTNHSVITHFWRSKVFCKKIVNGSNLLTAFARKAPL